MKRAARLTFLRVCKGLGLFAVSRRLTRHALRILCYHGFGVGDEADFRPGLFMRPSTFARRLGHLRNKKYPVVGLDAALRGLEAGQPLSCPTVITIDDGFYGTYRFALPLLGEFGFPATIYVTTYYAVKQTPIFRLVIQYLFWKARAERIEVSDLGVDAGETVDLTDADARESLVWKLIGVGETRADERERHELCAQLSRRLGVPLAEIETTRKLSLMSLEEIARAAHTVDVQLHTHRHRLCGGDEAVMGEISENRTVLEPLVGARLQHLCYPSGVWSADLWPALLNAGIRSATTCDSGLNYRDTPRLALKRFLDREDIAQIEFEAELSGFTEILRKLRLAWRRGAGLHAPGVAAASPVPID